MKKLCIFLVIILSTINWSIAQDAGSGYSFLKKLEEGVTNANEVSAKGDLVFPKLIFQSADIKAVVNFFAETGGINIIVDNRIKGTVDLKLRNVTWATAFQSIMNTFSLTLIREGNTFRAMRLDDFRSDILDERDYQYEKQTFIPRTTRIFSISYADANAMQSVLSGALTDRGKLVVDGRTNSIIVNDIPEIHDRIEELIDVLDIETPQIRVSAKILNVDKELIDELGVAWEISAGVSQGIATQGRTGNIPPNDQYVSLGVRAQDIGITDQLGAFSWGIVSGDYDIGAQIAALTSNNRGRIVDNPEIVTLDNQEAEILSGVKIPINTIDESGNVVTTFFDVGVSLKVRPHITSLGRVSMELYIERNSYSPSSAGYSIISRWARTNVIVDDNGALIIGGLTTQDSKELMRGVPILKDLPLIGRLFRFEQEQKNESELVIIITPHVIVN